MPKVFAPQQPSRMDAATRLWIPTMNMDPAKKYGEIVILLPPNAYRLSTAPMIAAMKERMADFTAEDYLIAVGDPSLIAAACCIASQKTGGLLRLLKWDRLASDYISVEIKV